MQQLQLHGISQNDKTFQVSVNAFICDAPAKAFLKCTKSHTSYYSCERCVVRGSWNGRVVYNTDEIYHRRTSEEFASLRYTDHQVEKSPLIDLGLKCVDTFPLDYMHLVCLGVVKRPFLCKLTVQQKKVVSEKLKKLSG